MPSLHLFSFVIIFHASSAHTAGGGGTDTQLTDIKVDKCVGLDGLFFFFTLLFYSCIRKILTYYSYNVLFIIPIIPSLNTIHRAPNIDSCYIDSPTNCTNIQ